MVEYRTGGTENRYSESPSGNMFILYVTDF